MEVAEKTARDQKEYFKGPLANDSFQFSPLPWIAFTHVSHTISGNNENAVPLIDWGEFYEKEGRQILPFSVQVHHSFVDGIHIGRLIDKLQKYLNEI